MRPTTIKKTQYTLGGKQVFVIDDETYADIVEDLGYEIETSVLVDWLEDMVAEWLE